jgi:hypothetical protein
MNAAAWGVCKRLRNGHLKQTSGGPAALFEKCPEADLIAVAKISWAFSVLLQKTLGAI